jgi:hypothetical protein
MRPRAASRRTTCPTRSSTTPWFRRHRGRCPARIQQPRRSRDEIERLVSFIVRSGRPVVSLDVPTGIDPDTGTSVGTAVPATATMTLPCRRPDSSPSRRPNRRLYLADLGLPAALYARLGLDVGPLFATARIIELDPAR